jgi:hypothetical protein
LFDCKGNKREPGAEAHCVQEVPHHLHLNFNQRWLAQKLPILNHSSYQLVLIGAEDNQLSTMAPRLNIVVLGGSGNVGSKLAHRLAVAGMFPSQRQLTASLVLEVKSPFSRF